MAPSLKRGDQGPFPGCEVDPLRLRMRQIPCRFPVEVVDRPASLGQPAGGCGDGQLAGQRGPTSGREVEEVDFRYDGPEEGGEVSWEVDKGGIPGPGCMAPEARPAPPERRVDSVGSWLLTMMVGPLPSLRE